MRFTSISPSTGRARPIREEINEHHFAAVFRDIDGFALDGIKFQLDGSAEHRETLEIIVDALLDSIVIGVAQCLIENLAFGLGIGIIQGCHLRQEVCRAMVCGIILLKFADMLSS